MKLSKYTIAIIAILLCLGFTLNAAAAVPGTMTYHGELSDGAGQPVNAPVGVEFRIFDAETDGTQAWSQPTMSIDVNDGSFSVQLGASTPLNDVFDGNTYWLEVVINGETLVPRTQIESVPYAFHASTAADANMLQGQNAADLIASAAAATETPSASDIAYDNSTSGLASNNLQAALDELAVLRARLDALESTSNSHTTSIATATANIATNTTNIASNTTKVNTATTNIAANTTKVNTATTNIAALTPKVNANTTNIATLTPKVANLEALTKDMERKQINGKDSVIFNKVNVHVRDGSNATISTTSGLGNLIIGYDEARSTDSVKTGAHNLIVGSKHNYSSYGGFVSGFENSITGWFASVSGGRENTAHGHYSSVSGGGANTAHGGDSSVTGGYNNTASGGTSSISGGINNKTSNNLSSVSGGYNNTASGEGSSVSGGSNNTASGHYASVSGGNNRSATLIRSWSAGSLTEAN